MHIVDCIIRVISLMWIYLMKQITPKTRPVDQYNDPIPWNHLTPLHGMVHVYNAKHACIIFYMHMYIILLQLSFAGAVQYSRMQIKNLQQRNYVMDKICAEAHIGLQLGFMGKIDMGD